MEKKINQDHEMSDSARQEERSRIVRYIRSSAAQHLDPFVRGCLNRMAKNIEQFGHWDEV